MTEPAPRPDDAPLAMPPHSWSDAESVSYEAAIEAVNEVVGAYSARIAEEETRPRPDAAAIRAWVDQQRQAHQLIRTLDPTDHEQIARVRRESAARAAQLRQR